ncbi:MAG: hypothetical protein MJ105_08290 [Lachnospiraceae bacterium]|nr:hypothetical protein [Lachnospiraceae bacterium]
MKKRLVALCDREEVYVDRLREYYESGDSFPFQICIFHDEKNLLTGMLKNTFEMVILSESSYEKSREELFKRKKGEALAILATRESERTFEKEVPYVLKYQSADAIRRELLRIYAEEASQPAFTKGSHEGILLGFYSPVKRIMQTKISLLVGQILAKKHKVLYVNLEPYAGEELLTEKGEKNLSDLLYYMKSDEEKTMSHLESMLRNMAGVDYIPPAESYIDLMAVPEADWKKLFNIIKGARKYDYILVDTGEIMQGLFSFLRDCDKTICMTDYDKDSKGKIEQFSRLLKEMNYEDVLDHICFAGVPNINGTLPELKDLYGSALCGYVRELVEEEVSGEV